jgi:hypothetical protein
MTHVDSMIILVAKLLSISIKFLPFFAKKFLSERIGVICRMEMKWTENSIVMNDIKDIGLGTTWIGHCYMDCSGHLSGRDAPVGVVEQTRGW